jgi:hypothetical protein
VRVVRAEEVPSQRLLGEELVRERDAAVRARGARAAAEMLRAPALGFPVAEDRVREAPDPARSSGAAQPASPPPTRSRMADIPAYSRRARRAG